ncbi:hypothetical protein [Almyronema epifaneia]|uniref:Uncharacterized protein n=1 Tax=Almyronema epifaneia S1 TaxID=2991925 RepID=A0ABW6I9H7_9CYAN
MMKVNSFVFSALILAALLLPACAGNNVAENTAADDDTTLEEVAESGETLTGESVVIRGQFEAKVSDALFLVQDENFLEGEAVLVLNSADSGFTVPEDEATAIWVTGEVRQFTAAEMRDYEAEIDPAVYADYENRPVIIAETLMLAPSPEEIAENPEVFYGQPIVVYGEVESVIDAGVFTLEEAELFDATRLLVVGQFPDPVEAGERIAIRGQLQPFVAATFAEEYDLTFDPAVQSELEAEFAEAPVLLAEEITNN